MDVERLFPQFIPLHIGIKPWLGSLIMQCFAIYAAICLVAVYFFLPGVLLDVTHRPESVPIYLSDKG